MLPAFHREHIAASVDVIVEETDAALDQLTPGTVVDLYAGRAAWRCAWRCARCSAWTPTAAGARSIDAAGLFEQALAFYASEYVLRVLRGRLLAVGAAAGGGAQAGHADLLRDRRAARHGRRGQDILSLLLDAEDEDGNTLSDLQIRDEVMTLMFAGHDTTTSTVSFMFYELARHPQIVERLHAEQDALLAGRPAQRRAARCPES